MGSLTGCCSRGKRVEPGCAESQLQPLCYIILRVHKHKQISRDSYLRSMHVEEGVELGAGMFEGDICKSNLFHIHIQFTPLGEQHVGQLIGQVD